jgi:hypothetical protein
MTALADAADPRFTGAQRTRLAAFEAAQEPEEVRRERVARAIFDASHPIVESFPDYWQRVTGGDETRDHYRRLADAAIAAMEPRW